MLATPADIVKLGATNMIVRAVLDSWWHGDVAYEQALQEMVVHLAYQNEQLLKSAIITTLTATDVNRK